MVGVRQMNKKTVGMRGVIRCAAILLFIFGSAHVFAADFTVTTNLDEVDSNTGDGICLTASGYCSLRAAVQQANALAGPDHIFLDSTTYTFTQNNQNEDAAASGDLDITDNLSITGQTASTTIIDANYLDRVLHVVNTSQLTLNDLTLKRGAIMSGDGGAILNHGVLTLNQVVIRDNTVSGSGGGIFHAGSSLSINHSTLTSNAAYLGGAMFAETGSVAVESTHIDANLANDGAGLYLNNASLTVSLSTIDSNTADFSGGAMVLNSAASISETQLNNNSAIVSGGAIHVLDSASLTMYRTKLIGNFTNSNGSLGGAIYADTNSVLEFNAVSLATNQANSPTVSVTYGGAIYSNASTLNLTNTTLSGNDAGQGGGLFLASGNANLNFSTFAHNGGHNVYNNGATLNIKNSIVANVASEVNCFGSVISLDHNLSDDTSCTFTNTNDTESTDPVLATLDATHVVHALVANSPAINQASNTDCPSIDGAFQRRDDGACDIGAYEAGAVLAQPGTLSINLDSSHLAYDESAGTITIPVSRTGGSDFSVSVDYLGLSDTAISGEDFVPLSGSLSWVDGDASDKLITITIVDDTLFESDEDFHVHIQNPTGSAVLGTLTNVGLRIVDNDPDPSVDTGDGGDSEPPPPDGGSGSEEPDLVELFPGNGHGPDEVPPGIEKKVGSMSINLLWLLALLVLLRLRWIQYKPA